MSYSASDWRRSRGDRGRGTGPTTLTLTVGMVVHDPAYGVSEDGDGEDSSFSGSVDELFRAIDEYAGPPT